mmetsp:Transcript_40874/g.123779  ORF Transcript_40874/g.123779 Transcript_40874/m.123779 type:complete len:112 (-) Transcript_40874:142-477(-)
MSTLHRVGALLLTIVLFLSVLEPARARSCNPNQQVCDAGEIEQEMKDASQRGFAFIQAASSRNTAKPKPVQVQEKVEAYNTAVKQQIHSLAAKHGSVTHKRTTVEFTLSEG